MRLREDPLPKFSQQRSLALNPGHPDSISAQHRPGLRVSWVPFLLWNPKQSFTISEPQLTDHLWLPRQVLPRKKSSCQGSSQPPTKPYQ